MQCSCALLATAFSLNPWLVPVVPSSTARCWPRCCCLRGWRCPEHVSMGTRQAESTVNFPARWTAREIANQRVKIRSWREGEGENSRKGRCAVPRRGEQSFQCCRNPCWGAEGVDALKMPEGLGSAPRMPEGLGSMALGSQLR